FIDRPCLLFLGLHQLSFTTAPGREGSAGRIPFPFHTTLAICGDLCIPAEPRTLIRSPCARYLYRIDPVPVDAGALGHLLPAHSKGSLPRLVPFLVALSPGAGDPHDGIADPGGTLDQPG